MSAIISLIGGVSNSFISNVKNVQAVDHNTLGLVGKDYRAFGHIIKVNSNTLRHIFRAGTGHLTGGDIPYEDYKINTGQWMPEVLLNHDVFNLEDPGVCIMDNGEIAVFYTMSDNGFNGNGINTERAYFMKYDAQTMAPTTDKIDYIGGLSGVPQLDRGWAFGKGVYHGVPGTYSMSLVQYSTNPATPTFKTGIIKTTNYWNTFTYYLINQSTTTSFSENHHAYLGSNRLVSMRRLDDGGAWQVWYSSDGGVTWSGVGPNGIGHYNGAVKICSLEMVDGKLWVIQQCRDSGFIQISRENDPNVFFGNLNFNQAEIVYDNREVSSSYMGLGYPSFCVMMDIPTRAYFALWADELLGGAGSTGISQILFTREDFVTDPAGVPVAPPTIDILNPAFTTNNSFRVDIQGYTKKQYENIKWFKFDISTTATFNPGTFITAKWEATGPNSVRVLQDVKLIGPWLAISQLNANTNYYIRIKACNYHNESGYTFKNIATLP
jgi:hypothetical protein